MPDIIFKADQGAGVRKIIRIMQGDKRSHVIRFVVPRYDSGVDLSPLTWYIKLIGAEGTPDIALPSALYEVTSEDIRVRWTVQGVSTENVGSVKFQLYGCGKDAEGHVISWTSGAGEIEVTENIGYEVSEEQEEQLGSLDQLIVFVQGELNNVIQAGNDAAAAAATANTAAGNANTATGNANAAIVRVDAAAAAARTATSEANTATTRANASAESAAKAADDANAVMDVKANALSATAAGNPVQIHPDKDSLIKPILSLKPIQEGSGDPSPENIRPITGRTGTELVRCGKNLLPNTATTQTVNGITFTVNPDGTVTVNGKAEANAHMTIPCSLRIGETYTLSGCPSGGGIGKYMMQISYFGNDYGDGMTAIATENTGPYVTLIVYAGTTASNLVFKPMIRLASDSDSTYEPYQGDTYTFDFGQTVYGCTLDWIKGELTTPDNRARAFDGTEGWVQAGSAANTFYLDYYNSGGSAGSPSLLDAICSHYKTSKSTTLASSDMAYYPLSYAGAIYRHAFTDSRFSTVAQWKAYLAAQKAAGTPVQAIEKLPAPTTIQLTPQQITALQGVNTVYGDADEITAHYNKSLNAAFEELKNAILAMGGNV